MLHYSISNGFEKTEAGGLSFFWSSLQNVILKHQTAIFYIHCYKLAVTKSFRKVTQPDKPQAKIKCINFLQLVYNGNLYVVEFCN